MSLPFIKKIIISFLFSFYIIIPLTAKTIKYDQIIQEEDGYYYGYGKADTKEDADFLAKKALIENALTTTLKQKDPMAKRVVICDAMVRIRLSKLKPYAKDKSGNYVIYRIKYEDWEKDENEFQKYYVLQELTDLFSKMKDDSLENQLSTSIEVLSKLIDYGEKDLFYLDGEIKPLSVKMERNIKEIIQELTITPIISSGFVLSNSDFAVQVKDKNNNVIPNIKLRATWDFLDMPDVILSVETNSDGIAYIKYPIGVQYESACVMLTVVPLLFSNSVDYQYLKKYESYSFASVKYAVYPKNKLFTGAKIPGGEYYTGAVPQDKKASLRENRKKVKIKSFEMSIYPVTNEQYQFYLYLTNNNEYPEYYDNDDYNGKDLPVVGISYLEAEKYVDWLSKQLGRKFRLPTNDEWEVAARAGQETIYPWGDEDPSIDGIANYRGNCKFEYPSPVGAFNNSNLLGLYDMSGNVWELTTSSIHTDELESERIVKGGSYMDGPIDLRISNFKTVLYTERYADVGFRLVIDYEGK